MLLGGISSPPFDASIEFPHNNSGRLAKQVSFLVSCQRRLEYFLIENGHKSRPRVAFDSAEPHVKKVGQGHRVHFGEVEEKNDN